MRPTPTGARAYKLAARLKDEALSPQTIVDLLVEMIPWFDEEDRPIIGAMVDALLAYVLRAWYEQEPGQSPAWAALADPAIGSALGRIHDEPARPWTVAGLAAESGLSRAAFARRFTAHMGEPPLTYLTRWRMITAAGMLRNEQTSLARVAEGVGYESQEAFSRAFKREYGVSPGAWRGTA